MMNVKSTTSAPKRLIKLRTSGNGTSEESLAQLALGSAGAFQCGDSAYSCSLPGTYPRTLGDLAGSHQHNQAPRFASWDRRRAGPES